jgi:CheY-like chemotaxis protein
MPKILILDDRDLNAKSLAYFLKTLGYIAVTSSDPLGFVELLEREKPDLALVDVKMPALSGDSLVEFVKSQPNVHRCPLVLWSSLYPEELRRLAKSSGADGYIHKSVKPDELEEEVRRYLR